MSAESPLTPEQEALLLEVLSGERARQDEAVIEAERNPTFARELGSLLGVQGVLDAAAERQRGDLDTPQPRLEEVAVHSVRAAMATDRAGQQGRLLSFRKLATVAAAIATFAVLWSLREREAISNTLGDELRIELTAGPTFRFEFAIPPGGAYRIELRTENGDVQRHRVEWPANAWTPAAEVVSVWSSKVDIKVEAMDRDGITLRRGSTTWLRGR